MSKIDEQILETERKLQELKALKKSRDPKTQIIEFLVDEGFDDESEDGKVLYTKNLIESISCIFDFDICYDGEFLFLKPSGEEADEVCYMKVSSFDDLKCAYATLNKIDEYEFTITKTFTAKYPSILPLDDEKIEADVLYVERNYCDSDYDDVDTTFVKRNG